MPSHLILVGACYLDTLLSVPFFPSEDSKLRATSSATRVGGNCPNSIQVLRQLFSSLPASSNDVVLHLISCLPARSSPASRRIASALTNDLKQHCPLRSDNTEPEEAHRGRISLEHCIYREDHAQPASSYILRSASTGTRTIINYNNLPEMSVAEFKERVLRFDPHDETWWHFEGRIPPTTLSCMQLVRNILPAARLSVEVEKPQRDGLAELASEADVIFYSRAWAESRGYPTPEACLEGESTPRASLSLCTWGAGGAAAMSHHSSKCDRFYAQPATIVVDAVGAGDTFIAAILYAIISHDEDWDTDTKVGFAVDLATRKVQQEGFAGLGVVATGTISQTA